MGSCSLVADPCLTDYYLRLSVELLVYSSFFLVFFGLSLGFRVPSDNIHCQMIRKFSSIPVEFIFTFTLVSVQSQVKLFIAHF